MLLEPYVVLKCILMYVPSHCGLNSGILIPRKLSKIENIERNLIMESIFFPPRILHRVPFYVIGNWIGTDVHVAN